MISDFTRSARHVGMASAAGVVSLGVAYLVSLTVGLATLPSPLDPIADPWFTALEILILVMMPFMVTLMLSVHAWAPRESKVHGLAAASFMALVAVITSAIHFAILTLGRQDAFQGMDWLLSFSWPSVVYALDILAWDFFFPLSVFFAIPVFGGGRLESWIRISLGASGVLALAGLAGVLLNDMQVRNIGIIGYAVVFPGAAALMGILFWRAEPGDRDSAVGVGQDGTSHRSVRAGMAALTPRQVLLLCGVSYAVLYPIVNDVIAATLYDGYSRMSQAVSELSARGAPTHAFLTAVGPVFSLLFMGFGLGVRMSARGSRTLRLGGLLMIAHGVVSFLWMFGPMSRREVIAAGGATSSDTLHLVLSAATGMFVTAYVATTALAFGWMFRLYSMLTIAAALLFGLLSAQVDKIEAGEPTPYMGLLERIGIGAWLLWVAVVAIILMRRPDPASRTEGT